MIDQIDDVRAFEKWWRNEGSGMPPDPSEEIVIFAERITRDAWLKGAHSARFSFSCNGDLPLPADLRTLPVGTLLRLRDGSIASVDRIDFNDDEFPLRVRYADYCGSWHESSGKYFRYKEDARDVIAVIRPPDSTLTTFSAKKLTSSHDHSPPPPCIAGHCPSQCLHP